jgi:integrase
MHEPTKQPPTRAVVRTLPTASNRGQLTLRETCDAYMAAYTGRDTTRVQRLGFWCQVLGDVRLQALDSDQVADALADLATTPALRPAGRDAAGATIWRERGPRSAATINRYRAALAAVLTWARHKRLTPKGWQHPVRETRAEPENNARARFLSADECERLLKVARISRWAKLRLLILMALTTGARRGELLGLRYGDVDLQAGTATLARTKNGEARVLVLTPAVVTEIKYFGAGAAAELLFASKRRPGRPHNFLSAWQQALKNAHIEGCTFHDLRHTAASRLAQSGASLVELSDFLGHRTM